MRRTLRAHYLASGEAPELLALSLAGYYRRVVNEAYVPIPSLGEVGTQIRSTIKHGPVSLEYTAITMTAVREADVIPDISLQNTLDMFVLAGRQCPFVEAMCIPNLTCPARYALQPGPDKVAIYDTETAMFESIGIGADLHLSLAY